MSKGLTKAEWQQERLRQEGRLLHRCEESFLDFIKFMHESGEPDFAYLPTEPHHILLTEAIQAFADGEFDNLLVMMPPGAGKSVIFSVQVPLWFWIRDPSNKILAASNTQDLANEFSGRRRGCMLNPQYQRFGISLTKESIDEQKNTAGGLMAAYGFNSAVVGKRANLILSDDPVLNSEQAASELQLDKLMRWYDQDFRSRKVAGAKELMVSTRWARQDPPGVILERIEKGKEKNWHVIRLPLICDSEDDPLGREMGKQMWKKGFDRNYIRNAKRDPLVFQTMYQQLPYIQDGDWVNEDCILVKKGQPDISKMKLTIGCDLALTQGGKKSDYTVFSVVGFAESGIMHVLEVFRNRHSPSESVKTLFDVCEKYPQARELLLDDDNASKLFKELILTELRHAGSHISVVPIMMPMKGLDKQARAVHLRSLFHQRRVHVWNRDSTPILIREVLGFPDGCKHDDIIDSLGLAAKRAIKIGTLSKTIEKKPESIGILSDKIDANGRQLSNMTLNDLHKSAGPNRISVVRRRI